MLMIAEVKEIAPSRYGFRAIIKHLPDQAFALDEPMYRRIARRFEAELSLWGTSESVHMMAITTFVLGQAGVPTIDELSLMPVTSHWLPVEDLFDLQITERLVGDCRSFIKPLRYNLPTAQRLPAAMLTDTENAPSILSIARLAGHGERCGVSGDVGAKACESSTWCWRITEEAMPALPSKRRGEALTRGQILCRN